MFGFTVRKNKTAELNCYEKPLLLQPKSATPTALRMHSIAKTISKNLKLQTATAKH